MPPPRCYISYKIAAPCRYASFTSLTDDGASCQWAADVEKESDYFLRSGGGLNLYNLFFCQGMINEDSSLCFDKTMPEIVAKTQGFDQLFNRIDHLEQFVGENQLFILLKIFLEDTLVDWLRLIGLIGVQA